MRNDVRYLILALLGVSVIAVLAVSFSGPLLYSLEKDVFPSQFHENTNALKAQEINSTTDLLPLMQDLLDYTGPIVLNVRIQDIEQARRDLELFAKDRRLNNLIIKLDMNESEIEEFSGSSANQEKLLQELLNSSVSLDQLKSLEIQYRDQDNPTMLTSIQLQGETLRKKIRLLYEQYRVESSKIVTISKKVGLDTTVQEQSVKDFEQYVNTIDPQQQIRQIDIPIRRTSQMSLLLYPDTGSYGDTIRCFGYYFSLYGYRVSSIPGKQVTLYLDNTPVATVTTDDVGSYTVDIPVDKITSGTHVVHAESGLTQSDQRTLTIVPVDTVTTLTISTSRKAGEILCTGTVTANQPVRNAPVELVWDGTHQSRATTDAKGEFNAALNLPNGNHTVQARFTGTGYPLNPSESDIQAIDISIPLNPLILHVDYIFFVYLGVLCIFSLFIGGAAYYLRRTPGRTLFSGKRAARTDLSGDAGPETPAISDEGTRANIPPDTNPPDEVPAGYLSLFQRYAGLLQSAGLSEASHAVYCDFAGRIAHDLRIPRHRVLTPREMSRSCRERPYCGAFSRLVSAYERIRYGGYLSVPVRTEFETTMHTTDSQLEGEHH
jgi:hypothetical protein